MIGTPSTPQALGFAMLRRARAGVAMAGVMNDEAKLCFWQGVGDAAVALIDGVAERLAVKDSQLSQQEQTGLLAAAAALPERLKDLSMADVQKVLTAHRVELAAHASASPGRADSAHGVFHEGRFGPTNAAAEHHPVDPQVSKDRVGLCTCAHQVNAAAAVAAQPLGVVARKAVKPLLAVLRLRLRLLQLRAQIAVLTLQRPDPLSQKGQVLAQHRSRAALVDERLHLFEQRLKHFVLHRGSAPHRSEGAAA